MGSDIISKAADKLQYLPEGYRYTTVLQTLASPVFSEVFAEKGLVEMLVTPSKQQQWCNRVSFSFGAT